jgi:hypothetical protein
MWLFTFKVNSIDSLQGIEIEIHGWLTVTMQSRKQTGRLTVNPNCFQKEYTNRPSIQYVCVCMCISKENSNK